MRIHIILIYLLLASVVHAQVPKVSSGRIVHIENFKSKYGMARNIDIWLPDGYSPKGKYAVLYMHDGQALYDSAIMWNHQEWKVDEVASALIKNNKVQPFIVVGMWNTGATRHSDYFPQKPFESLTPAQQDTLYAAYGSAPSQFKGKVQSDNYLKFVVTEVRPFVDSAFSVYTDAAHTFIAGSSMGGLISMYAICEYPNVFGGAACLSTHWPGASVKGNNPIPAAFLVYLQAHLPNPATHKLYFDHGTATLDTQYAPYQLQADSIIRAKGYTDANFMTKVFDGADHTEHSWAKRLDIPLVFLLNKVKK